MPKKNAPVVTKRSLDTKGFYSDYSHHEPYYSALVRSPTATGIVRNIFLEDIPEGYHLFTAKDIPGKKTFNVNDVEINIFSHDNVSFAGEPLGILVGPDEAIVQKLLEKVTINFDIETLESALKNAINQHHRPFVDVSEKTAKHLPHAKNSVETIVSEINELPPLNTVLDTNHIEKPQKHTVASREIKTGIFAENTIEEAEKILFTDNEDCFISEETWTEKLTDLSWQETAGAFCYMENDCMHVFAPTKWPSLLIKVISDCLDLPEESIFINKTNTSGIYSKGLWRTTQIAAQVAVAAFLVKKPVKLILTQKEQDHYMIPGVKTDITYKTAVRKDGKVNGMSVLIDVDVGALNPFSQEIIDRIAIASCNYYKFENVHILAQAHTSKNPPSSICIKSIDSQAFFAIENQIQKLSNQVHLLPEDIRKINTNTKARSLIDIPSKTALETLFNTIQMSDFNRKYTSFHMDAIDRLQKNSNPFFAVPLRGIGIATGYNVSEFYGSTTFSYDTKIEVTLLPKERVVIHAIRPSEVIQNIWRETVSEILQIKKENIIIDSEFYIKDIPPSPEDSFSTIGTMNELIKKCCNDIQKKRFHQPLPITSKKGLTGTAKKNWNKEAFSGIPFANMSFATCVVEVELDTYTYSEKIKGIWLTVDCGELFDEQAALRTIRLEIQQELSMLVEEKSIHCDKISVKFIQSKNKSGQVGALVHNTLPAAFSSALSLALATQLTKLPCTEAQIFNLIKERETSTQLSQLPSIPQILHQMDSMELHGIDNLLLEHIPDDKSATDKSAGTTGE